MKTKLIVILSIIFIVFFIGIYVYYDYSRTIEEVTSYSQDDKFAYSLKDEGNKVIFTLYQKHSPEVKNITIYNIVNNIVSSISYEQHYTNKKTALYESKQDKVNTTNISVKNNIMYYTPIASAEIGMTKDSLMETLSGFEKIYIKVTE